MKKDRFDRWDKDLSPSRELLQAYRSKEETWDVFKSDFVAELKANPSSLKTIRALRAEIKKGNVTLLCYERAGNPCHRHVVAELVVNPKLLIR